MDSSRLAGNAGTMAGNMGTRREYDALNARKPAALNQEHDGLGNVRDSLRSGDALSLASDAPCIIATSHLLDLALRTTAVVDQHCCIVCELARSGVTLQHGLLATS